MIVKCGNPSCDATFDDQSEVQPIPKRYCSYAHKHSGNRKRREAATKEENRIHRIAKGEMSFTFDKVIKRSGIISKLHDYDREELMDAFVNALEDRIEDYWDNA